jgi:hypothetical protein
MNKPKPISVAKAILIGHVCVNGGVLLVMLASVFICRFFNLLNFPIALGLGAVLGWPWWSVSVPRWRRWALAKGVDAEQLQKWGVRTGLVWPKGWIPEKTEFPPRKR